MGKQKKEIIMSYKWPFVFIILLGSGCSTTGTKIADSQVHPHKTEKIRSPQAAEPDEYPEGYEYTGLFQDCPDLTGNYKAPPNSTFLTHQQKIYAHGEKNLLAIHFERTKFHHTYIYNVTHGNDPIFSITVNGRPKIQNDDEAGSSWDFYYCERQKLFYVSLDFNNEGKLHGAFYTQIRALESGNMEHRQTSLNHEGKKSTHIDLYIRQ